MFAIDFYRVHVKMDNQEMQQSGVSESFEPKYRIDEEYEYYTELATNASQLWIESILHKRLSYQDDFRKSLEDGVILCELLNTLRPGCIKKINRLPSKIAGIDNLTVFLQTCSDVFSLHEKQLFQVSDLEDLSERAIPANQLADEQGKRIRRVLTTVYYLAKAATGLYDGSPIDFSAFTGIVAPLPPSSANSSGNGLPNYNREASVSNGNGTLSDASRSRSESGSPVSSAKTASAPSTVRQNTRVDQSPTRLSDAGSFDSSSNLSSNQNEQPANAQNVSRPQNRTSQAHHYVKSGFSLPTGPSNLTKTAVEQMRLISESRSSGAFQPPVRHASLATTTVHDEDAWQSDLDMWRMRRKQSLQSTLPSEVLESVGMLDDGNEGFKFSDNSEPGSTKKSNKKPGLLSKLRYSIEQDSEDPIVVVEERAKEKKDSLASFASSMKERLPPIADTVDSSTGAAEKEGDDDNKEEGKKEQEEEAQQNNTKSSPLMSTMTTTNETQSSETDGYKDMVFTISQAPGNLRGFGFSIKGGRDAQMPLTIDRVTAGSAADEADLLADDEIRKINNETVAHHFRPTLNRLIQQCVKAGQISLTIRRYTNPPQQPQTADQQPSSKPLPPTQQKPLPTIVSSSSASSLGKGDGVDNNNSQRVTSPRAGPGPLVMEQEVKVRSPEPPPVAPTIDESDQWLKSQALGSAAKPSQPATLQQSTSPALSSSSSSSNNGQQQQRLILGIPRGYRGSPSGQQNSNPLTSSTGSSSGKDESITSAVPPEMPRNGSTRSNGSIGASSGAILVRGAANNSNNNSNPTVIGNQSPSTNGNVPQEQQGRPPYSNNQSQIPQPWSPNNNQNTAPLHQHQQPQADSYNGVRNGSAKKENGGSREQPPQTPPQLPRSVSSRELCAACAQPLGAGPAMAIERLGLFYHVRCFRCSVCKVCLSNGQTGVDVRVKGSRLHCQNCNSSDESGLQSSQV